jgi:hypothetical protein
MWAQVTTTARVIYPRARVMLVKFSYWAPIMTFGLITYKETSWNKSSFITEDTKVKHTNITTIYKANYYWKVYTKVIKTPS